MPDSDTRRGVQAAGLVLGLAGLAIAAGLLTPHDPVRHATRASLERAAETAQVEAARLAQTPVDPQPEVVVQHIAFTLSGSLERPEVAALLNRVGGADPSIRGLVPADPMLDDVSIQREIMGVPGAARQAVMGVIVQGGHAAGITVESTQTDPTTGMEVGRSQVTVLVTVTVLADGRLAISASLRDERDTTALSVLGRRLGIPLGTTGEVEDVLVVQPGEPVAIRLPGSTLRVVFMTIGVTPARSIVDCTPSRRKVPLRSSNDTMPARSSISTASSSQSAASESRRPRS